MSLLPTTQEAADMQGAVEGLFNDSCVILDKRQLSDGQGGSIETWGAVNEVPCRQVPVKQQYQASDQTNAQGIVSKPIGDLDILVPLGTQINELNRVIVAGKQWRVLTVLLRSTHIKISLGGNLDG